MFYSIHHNIYCQDFLAEVTSVGLQTQYEAVCENLGLIAYLVQVLVALLPLLALLLLLLLLDASSVTI